MVKGKKRINKKFLSVFVYSALTLLFSIIPSFAGQKVFFYHTDAAGTPVAMTDAGGNVVWRADYKPFGEEQSVTPYPENNKKFAGKEMDKETGLYYFGARYMDAGIGRFVSVDPKGITEKDLLNPQRLNRYNYSLNNPYRYIDPDGKWPTPVHNTIIKRAFSGGNYMLSPKIIAAIQRGSAEADSGKYQDTGHSYMHAMRAKGQDAGDATGLAVTFITQKMAEYKTLMNEGKTVKAYEALGMAMHPLMDATSPSHEGMQEWKLIPLIDVGIHKSNETERVFDSKPDYSEKSVNAIRKLYDEIIK
jgi:RHS repeat-associated protein